MDAPWVYPESPPRQLGDLAHVGPGSRAGIGQRVAARLIDAIIIEVPLALTLQLPYIEGTGSDLRINAPGWALALSALIPLIYEAAFLVFRQATPGKRLVGIGVFAYVGGAAAEPYQYGFRVILPNMGAILALAQIDQWVTSLLTLWLPFVYLSALLDPIFRGLHDKDAGTIVLRTR